MNTCGVCGRKVRRDAKGRCARCRASHYSTRRCACGCGRLIDDRSRGTYSKTCALRLAWKLGNRLATLAAEGDARASALLVAIRELSDRTYSAVRFDRLHAAVLAFGGPTPSTFLGDSSPLTNERTIP
jgi:hypothetical protein